MTGKSMNEGAGLEALEEVLERFGSDRTRWPAPVRRTFAGLLAQDAAAKARLREAEALDRLLDLAPEPELDTRALADRIVAAAMAETPAVAPPKARVAWAIFDRRTAAEGQWPAAALLAASLVLGTVFGMAGTFDAAMAPLVAEASYETDIDPAQLAFDSDAISMFEEDLL
ncbi:hypothetical protein [Hyphomicrobium sp.]|uniref:hypothetical protein n=1 Tax=Hyphomicrobium sp. TaxID=82 RepID=UPI0025C2D70B|nr:hypothetical protein [Hyphomicrobium sp.]MCC7253735.1 hypothetical protein [Hyphomicrobium sp.]